VKLSQEVNPTNAELPGAPAAGVLPEAVSPSAQNTVETIDPEQYYRVAEIAQQQYERLQTLAPIESEIQELMSDPELLEFYRTSKGYYKQGKTLWKPTPVELPDEVREVVNYVKTLSQREQEQQRSQEHAANQARDEFRRQQMRVAQRLQAEKGLSPEHIGELSAYADALYMQKGGRAFVGLEEAYESVQRFGNNANAKPARVVNRGGASAPGIPNKEEPVIAAKEWTRGGFSNTFRTAMAEMQGS
jgi:hypothetical protein